MKILLTLFLVGVLLLCDRKNGTCQRFTETPSLGNFYKLTGSYDYPLGIRNVSDLAFSETHNQLYVILNYPNVVSIIDIKNNTTEVINGDALWGHASLISLNYVNNDVIIFDDLNSHLLFFDEKWSLNRRINLGRNKVDDIFFTTNEVSVTANYKNNALDKTYHYQIIDIENSELKLRNGFESSIPHYLNIFLYGFNYIDNSIIAIDREGVLLETQMGSFQISGINKTYIPRKIWELSPKTAIDLYLSRTAEIKNVVTGVYHKNLKDIYIFTNTLEKQSDESLLWHIDDHSSSSIVSTYNFLIHKYLHVSTKKGLLVTFLDIEGSNSEILLTEIYWE